MADATREKTDAISSRKTRRSASQLKLNNLDLRQMLKMLITRAEHKVVLDNESRNPQIVDGNRRALAAKLSVEAC